MLIFLKTQLSFIISLKKPFNYAKKRGHKDLTVPLAIKLALFLQERESFLDHTLDVRRFTFL